MAHARFGWERRFHTKAEVPLNLVPIQTVDSPTDPVLALFENLQTDFQSIAFPMTRGYPTSTRFPSWLRTSIELKIASTRSLKDRTILQGASANRLLKGGSVCKSVACAWTTPAWHPVHRAKKWPFTKILFAAPRTQLEAPPIPLSGRGNPGHAISKKCFYKVTFLNGAFPASFPWERRFRDRSPS